MNNFLSKEDEFVKRLADVSKGCDIVFNDWTTTVIFRNLGISQYNRILDVLRLHESNEDTFYKTSVFNGTNINVLLSDSAFTKFMVASRDDSHLYKAAITMLKEYFDFHPLEYVAEHSYDKANERALTIKEIKKIPNLDFEYDFINAFGHIYNLPLGFGWRTEGQQLIFNSKLKEKGITNELLGYPKEIKLKVDNSKIVEKYKFIRSISKKGDIKLQDDCISLDLFYVNVTTEHIETKQKIAQRYKATYNSEYDQTANMFRATIKVFEENEKE